MKLLEVPYAAVLLFTNRPHYRVGAVTMSTASSHAPPLDSSGRQASQAQRTAEAKAAFTASLAAAGTHIDTELQERAKNIHANDKALTRQEKDLQKEIQKLSKQNNEMQKFLDKSNKQLTSLPSIEPLQADLENDLDDLDEILRMIEEDENSLDDAEASRPH